MTPAEARASHEMFLAEGGEDLLIRRGNTDTPARGKAVSYSAKDLAGSAVISDRRFVVLVDAAVAAILPLDVSCKLVRGSKEMKIKRIDDEARRFAGELVALEIWVSI